MHRFGAAGVSEAMKKEARTHTARAMSMQRVHREAEENFTDTSADVQEKPLRGGNILTETPIAGRTHNDKIQKEASPVTGTASASS